MPAQQSIDHSVASMEREPSLVWLGARPDARSIASFGIRLAGGGAHQSKTMMSEELGLLLGTGVRSPDALRSAVTEENVLGKATATTRTLTHRHLASLYGLNDQPPLSKALFALWQLDPVGRPILALLVALARDPLLRDTARVVLESPIGLQVSRESFENALADAHPGRFSVKMIRSMAQNCSATWTQAGHLRGKIKKFRIRAAPMPAAAALAALIATVCGFGGPSILSSAWMRILDLSPEQALDMLKRAEAMGLARVRSAGDVTEIAVRQPMATTLGVKEIEFV